MTDDILKAWQIDIDGRMNGINRRNAAGYDADVDRSPACTTSAMGQAC